MAKAALLPWAIAAIDWIWSVLSVSVLVLALIVLAACAVIAVKAIRRIADD